MERSSLRLPDPAPQPRLQERRRTVRQKLHSPVYVSFNGPQSGMVVDLSELLDLHEHGFGVQTAMPNGGRDRLEVNRAVTLCLDLPETRKYVHGSGQVMWIDDSGRAGVRFSFLPDAARHILKEWLFANLLIASTNYNARQGQLAHRLQELEPPREPSLLQSLSPDSPGRALTGTGNEKSPASGPALALSSALPYVRSTALPERGELLTSLDDLRREVREIKSRQKADAADTALYLITERAMILTGATGAALALLTGERMLCRARVGDPAPRLGSEVDAKTGLSGECVRTGRLVTCEDPENDPRVDPEVCRRLGIGSFVAAPILSDDRVIGLLEIFSPFAQGFAEDQGTILERLVELVPQVEQNEEKREPKSEPVSGKPGEITAGTQIQKPTGSGTIGPTAAQPIHAKPDQSEPVLTASGQNELGAAERRAVAQRTTEPETSESLKTVTAIEAGDTVASQSKPDRIPSRIPVRVNEIQRRETGSQPTRFKEEQPESDADAIRALAQRMRLQQHVVFEEDLQQVDSPRQDMLQDLVDAPAPVRRSYLVHLGLLALAVAVVALVLGYLLAPIIQKRWNPAQSSRNARPASTNASTASASPQRTAADRRALSPLEIRQLADQGDPDAQWQLGILYHDGAGVPQDDTQAVKWFQRAADQGYVLAQSTLGAYYWAGRGVPQDFSKAYFWSQLALAQGDENSKSRLEGLAAQMTPGQVARARQDAEAWLHSYNESKKPNLQSNR